MRDFLFNHAISSHILVALQMSGIALYCYPEGMQNLGSMRWLILCTIGETLGVLTLCCNKVGNFSVCPEIKQQAALITYGYIRHPMHT